MKYDQLVKLISDHDLSSFLLSATNATWYFWNNSGVDPAVDVSSRKFLTRAYAGRIAAIGAAKCSHQGVKKANNLDIANLSELLLAVDESVSDQAFFDANEVKPLELAVGKSPVLGPYAHNGDLIRQCAAQLMPSRAWRAQWEHRAHSVNSIIRHWSILERVDKNTGTLFEDVGRTYNIGAQDFVRACFLLFGVASGTRKNPAIGKLNITSSKIEPEFLKRFNLDIDAIRLVSSKISRDCSGFQSWHQEVEKVPEVYRKYYPHPLVDTPLIRLDGSFSGVDSADNYFLCPSPAHLIWKTKNACLGVLENLIEEKKKILLKALGDATEAYMGDMLEAVCGKGNVVKVDDILGNDEGERKADYIVLAGDTALIIESKRSIAPVMTKTILSPQGVVDMWDRMYSAVEQCSSLIRSDIWIKIDKLKAVKNFVCVVCVNDTLLAEGSLFNFFAHRSGILKKMNIESLEIIGIEEFEDMLIDNGPGTLIDVIKLRASVRGSMEPLEEICPFVTFYKHHVSPSSKPFGNLDHLRESSSRLFPGLNLLQIKPV